MSDVFPPDIQQYVRQEIASGHYQSEEELVLEAVRFLRDSNLRLEQLREGLEARLDRLQGGEGIKLEDDEALGSFFDEIEAEVHEAFSTGGRTASR